MPLDILTALRKAEKLHYPPAAKRTWVNDQALFYPICFKFDSDWHLNAESRATDHGV
jgi:hypothetical protein